MSASIHIQSIYGGSESNESLTLYEGRLRIVWQDLVVEGEGRVFWKWLPHPEVRFEVTSESRQPQTDLPFHPIPVSVELEGINLMCEGHVLGASATLAPPMYRQNTSGALDATSQGNTMGLRYLVFHLPNFPHFAGDSIDEPNGMGGWIGRIVFSSDDWKVTIDSVRGHRDLYVALQRDGGFAITAVGELERQDGGRFSVEDAKEPLRVLWLFSSFVRGAWTSPVLELGLDEDRNRIWSRWNAPFIQEWRGPQTCFPEQVVDAGKARAPIFEPLFRRLTDLDANPEWREPLTWTISWLLRSNTSRSAETSLVLAHSGLELLAWLRLVQEGLLPMDEAAFDSLPAGLKIKLLLKASGIPTEVPDGTTINELADLAFQERLSGPQIVSRVRNQIVHPRRGGKRPSARARLEASRLAMWYLELALLRVLNYHDSYANRLRASYAEIVPWA